MNLIDLLLILIILLGIYSGYLKGFVQGIIELLSMVCGFLFAFWAYKPFAALIDKYISPLGIWTLPLAFIIAYIFARTITSLIAGRLVGRVPAGTTVYSTNRLLGILPGAVNGLINAAIISILLLAFPLADGLSVMAKESKQANRFVPHVSWLEEQVAPVFDKAINHTISKLTIEPESGKSVDLNFTVKAPTIREDLEAKMLLLVNEERRKNGLPALIADPEMRLVARAHSADMFARGYFSHVTPDGKTLGDRAHAKGVRFITAGENLALAPTLSMAHTGLMNSPGHRANILRASYGRLGIGILDGGRYGLMVTQNFRN